MLGAITVILLAPSCLVAEMGNAAALVEQSGLGREWLHPQADGGRKTVASDF